MEDALTFFFDSYALIEIYEKNPKFEKYSKANVVTTISGLWSLLQLDKKWYTKDEINDFFEFCKPLYWFGFWMGSYGFWIQTNHKKEIILCRLFRYIIQKYGIKFLTGDKEFENLLM